MSNEQNVRVSVIMIASGTDAGLSRRLESVVSQLGTEDEMIIVACKETAEMAACAAAHNVNVKTAAAGENYPWNLETALRQSSGDYIFLAESCDTWHPSKLVSCIKALEQGAIAAVHDAVVVDGDLNELVSSLLGYSLRQKSLHGLFQNRSIGCCMAFRRELLAVALPFPLPGMSPDRWLWAAARRIGRVVFIDRILMFYCSHRIAAGRSRVFNTQRKRTDLRELYRASFELNRRIRLFRDEQYRPK